MPNDSKLINDAITEARTLRNLSMSNARHSLVRFLNEEKLPLNDLADAELDLDTFVDLIIKRSRERAKEDDELNPRGFSYKNCQHKLRKQKFDSMVDGKQNIDDELGERKRYFDGDEDFELDFGDGTIEKYNKDDDDEEADDKKDKENFSEAVIAEKSHKWDIFRNFRTVPATAGTAKLSEKERNLLIRHAGLKENKEIRHLKDTQDAKEVLKQRANIIKSNKHLAKDVIRDINIKQKLTK